MYLQESNIRSHMLDVQEANFHSSTESDVVSLDAGLRMDGILALDLWDLVVEVSHVPSNQSKARSNLLRDKHCENIPTRERRNKLPRRMILSGQLFIMSHQKTVKL